MNNIITADYQFAGNENFEHDTFETAEELQKFFSDFYSMEQDIKNITLTIHTDNLAELACLLAKGK